MEDDRWQWSLPVMKQACSDLLALAKKVSYLKKRF